MRLVRRGLRRASGPLARSLGKEFFQKADEVYWLKIVALVDLPAGIIVDPNQPPTFLPR